MITRIWIFGAMLGILSLPLHGVTAIAETVKTSADAAQTIVIDNLSVQNDSSGAGPATSVGSLRTAKRHRHQRAPAAAETATRSHRMTRTPTR
jgi:hypothetical protein